MLITRNHYQRWLEMLHPQFLSMETPQPGELRIDSRTIKESEWYIPILGSNFNGHSFIESAMKNGAKGFFFDKKSLSFFPKHLRTHGIEVADTTIALQKIAQGYRNLFHIPIIAITGSAGKTTTKNYLAAALGDLSTMTSPGNFNNEIGVPLSLLKLNSKHNYAILEFGARHMGDIAALSKIANPTHRLITNIGSAHVGEFGSFENLAQAKLELFENAQIDDTLIVNRDDQSIVEWINNHDNKHCGYGVETNSDVTYVGFEKQADSWRHQIKYKNCFIDITTNFYHTSLPSNLAATIATASTLELDIQKIATKLSEIKPSPGRFQPIHKNGKTYIDDTYNANPESMQAGLQSIAKGFPSNSKVIILGDMLELGEISEQAHRNIGALILNISNVDQLITVGSMANYISNEAISVGFSKSKISHFDKVQDLIPVVARLTEHSEVIYAKASNGVGLNTIIERLVT